MSKERSKIEPAVKDIEIGKVESEKECFKICQENFCYALVFDEQSGNCKCIYCTGFMRD
ncbi:hypothetical protein EYM_07715 [Ignicoccus islandicus DSM 13165]|uniref:Uncharacterized protein n=1 Tax=Ignicoccus islandicus DSM 13165 TaxID=940295 RepID=A0A0U3DYZ2_9CREN|nr:hypothetical protein [Ignicoccus islandicus]ALU12810.1 hypothetical protein EYM_07715 [Ignicoccus islandicus DSM 13165]